MTQAIVVGASIAGLAAALALRRLGYEVHLLERGPGPMTGRGAALGIDMDLVAASVGDDAARDLPHLRLSGRALHYATGRSPMFSTSFEPGGLTVSTWDHLYSALARANTAPIAYDANISAIEVGAPVVVIDRKGSRSSADLVIGADGHGSIVRSAISAEAEPDYAGYFLWRGFLDADRLSDETAQFFLDGRLHVFGKKPYHFIAYEAPGLAPERRRLNWGWYAAVPDDERAAIVARAGGRPSEMIVEAKSLSARDADSWSSLADAVWPAPFARLVEETVAARAMFGNAIYEWSGRPIAVPGVALVGDAAHLMSPITGAGARSAMTDALIFLEEAQRAPERALQAYQRRVVGDAAARIAQARAWAREALGAEPTYRFQQKEPS